MKPALVCVFGVSGVGKSRVIADFVSQNPEWGSLSVSEIITTELKESPEAFRTARGDAVAKNQRTLADAVARRRSLRPNESYLLDAHVVIEGDISSTDVELSVLAAMRVDGFVVVVDSPIAIFDRRRNDGLRGRPIKSEAEISALQARTLDVTKKFSSALGVPYAEVRSGHIDAFKQAIFEMRRSNRD